MKEVKLEVKDEVREGDAGVRVCSNERYHNDDMEGECDECHKPVFYRPTPPFLIKKLCMDCGFKMMASQDLNTILCTRNTFNEIAEWKKGQTCKPGQNTPTPPNPTKSRR